ncbi:bifunctional diguanylate cyclase/phosphodiesterase [Vibrio intestinalis]|uniref:bifunctional diguanylate cyclase/phosphodiesterase n=1 Tax=Vibrio intestinalis TaxID=2933291 RepID=UPI0021A8EDE6|nr:cache domain-containing protein [Vibrio intestinalis]
MTALTDKKLLNIVKTLPFVLILIFIAMLLTVVINSSQQRANEFEQNLIDNNLAKQKEIIAQRVESAAEQINYQREQTVSVLKSEIKQQVETAHQIATAIYKENLDKPENEIKKLISDALRDIRFNNGRGYFFIYQMDGVSVMHALLPEREGQQMIESTDSRGVPILKQHIDAIASSKDKAAFYRWWFKKPQEEGEFEKIGYGQYFEPFDWFIGTGEYVYEVENEIKKNILNWVSNYRFGETGYIFVLDQDGTILAHKDPELLGERIDGLVTRTLGMFAINNTTSSHVEYDSIYKPDSLQSGHKVSFMKFDSKWGWLLGSGVYIEEVHSEIEDQLEQLQNQHQMELIKVIALCLTLALILTLLSLLLSNYLGRRFLKFQNRIANDFNQLEVKKEQLRHQAQHDALTHLPNRILLEKQAMHGIIHSRELDKKLAILFVDLDNFKRINDKYGHEVGDQLLVEVAQRFSQLTESKGTVARFGGDEFVFCIPEIESDNEARTIAMRVQACLKTPFIVHGITTELNATIGISLFPTDGEQPRTLMSKADIVLTRSKKYGKGEITFFDKKISDEIENNFLLEDEFKSALVNGELDVHYQPQVNATTNKMMGIEALCRWISPTLGFVSPMVFIDIAEKNNSILQLGEFVFERACRDTKKLNQSLNEPVTVSVNISPKQLLHKGFIDMIVNTAKHHELASNLIILELTENVFIEDLKAVQPTLKRLQDLGFGISLDDFGTGFSSLSYLNALPISEIKIDRSFIIRMLNSRSNLNIVKTIIAIARSNDIEIIAEGVESEQQQQVLIDLGCELIQGYLYSKPVPMHEVQALASTTFTNSTMLKADTL